MKLGCPSTDEIEKVAEIKATRDVLEHNSGAVSRIYLGKAGGKARFKEGDSIEVPDAYLRESWELLKRVCNDMTKAAIRWIPSLTSAEIAVAETYYRENQQALDEEDRLIRERGAQHKNPPWVEKVLADAHSERLAITERLRREANGEAR